MTDHDGDGGDDDDARNNYQRPTKTTNQLRTQFMPIYKYCITGNTRVRI